MDEFNPKHFFSSRITMVSAEDGGGKSSFCLDHPLRKHGYYLDLENKYLDMFEVKGQLLSDNQYTNCLILDKKFKTDRIKTFENVRTEIQKLFRRKDIKLIVIDGISDIRRMAKDKWLAEHPKRKSPTKFEYSAINQDVRDLLYPLINYARMMRSVQIVFTSWLIPEFDEKKDQYTGKMIPDVKPFITSRIDEILAVQRKGLRFFIKRNKSPRGPTDWIEWTDWNKIDDDEELEEELEEEKNEEIRKDETEEYSI